MEATAVREVQGLWRRSVLWQFPKGGCPGARPSVSCRLVRGWKSGSRMPPEGGSWALASLPPGDSRPQARLTRHLPPGVGQSLAPHFGGVSASPSDFGSPASTRPSGARLLNNPLLSWSKYREACCAIVGRALSNQLRRSLMPKRVSQSIVPVVSTRRQSLGCPYQSRSQLE